MAIRLTYRFDDFYAATVAASSEAASELGPANVLNPQPARVWRASGDTAEWISFDLGSAKKLTCIGIFNHNFTAGATVTLEADSAATFDSDGGNPAFSLVLEVAVDADAQVLKRIVAYLDQTYRYWRISIADAGNSAGYVEVGCVAAGQYWEPEQNIRDPYRYIASDSSGRDRVPGVWTPSITGDRYSSVEVSFGTAKQTQVDKMRAIFNKVGNENPLILSLEPLTRPSIDTMYCMLETPMAFTSVILDYWDVISLVFEEKVR